MLWITPLSIFNTSSSLNPIWLTSICFKLLSYIFKKKNMLFEISSLNYPRHELFDKFTSCKFLCIWTLFIIVKMSAGYIWFHDKSKYWRFWLYDIKLAKFSDAFYVNLKLDNLNSVNCLYWNIWFIKCSKSSGLVFD